MSAILRTQVEIAEITDTEANLRANLKNGQIGISNDTARILARTNPDGNDEGQTGIITSSDSVAWGEITGTVSNQADLEAAFLGASLIGANSGVCGLDINGKVSTTNLPSAILGALEYQGTWDCSTAAYPTGATKGQYWICSVAGTISGTVYAIHDWLVYNGTAWNIVNNQTPVLSVAGKTGTVTLSVGDISGAMAASGFTSSAIETLLGLTSAQVGYVAAMSGALGSAAYQAATAFDAAGAAAAVTTTSISALSLDQTTPQAVQNGAPDFQGGVATPTINDDGAGLTINNNSAGLQINSNSSDGPYALQVNLNATDESGIALNINSPTDNPALAIDGSGNVIVGSGNGEQLVLNPQSQPGTPQGPGAMYFDSTTNLPYVWTGSSWVAFQVATNPLIINSSNYTDWFTGGTLTDGYIVVEQFQYFLRLSFAVHVGTDGTLEMSFPQFAGLFLPYYDSEVGGNWQMSVSAQPSSGSPGMLYADQLGNVYVGNLVEGTSLIYGTYDLTFNALSL